MSFSRSVRTASCIRVDYPYEDVVEAREWFDRAAISESDRTKISHANARKLMRL
jgi:predicted TIM-barrel fold metal-dependent hydrolase